MELHTNNHGFEGMLPEKRIAMRIKSSAKMFEILSSGIYKDKIYAVIREYVCNAYDAHVTAGEKDTPFTVNLPNRLNPIFSVSDVGTGIDPDKIGDIFWTYGESSKTNNNDTIGALGLGSKSAFAYTKSSFIVRDRYNGVEYTFFCFINEHGEPEGSPVGEAETDQPNGITVEFAVRTEDIGAFHERFRRMFKYWSNVKPIVTGYDGDPFATNPNKVIEGKEWYLEAASSVADRRTALAIMGNVQYPIEADSIPNLPDSLRFIANNPFVIHFPMGSLEFASSRESLSYTEYTNRILQNRLEEVRKEIADSFYEQVFNGSDDHLSFFRSFSKTFNEFRNVVYLPASSGLWGDEAIIESYVKLLIGKNHNSSIDYLGRSFNVKDLINGVFETTLPQCYQSFGILAPSKKGRVNQRFYLQPATFLSFTALEDIDADLIYSNGSYKINKGKEVISNEVWRAPYVSPRLERFSMIDRVIKNKDLFSVTTLNHFKITHDRVIFVINDVGTTGPARFKEIYDDLTERNKHSIGSDCQLVYVSYNPKVSDYHDVALELNTLIESSLNGAEIKLLSELPDLRKAIEKEKIDRESIRVKYRHIARYCHHNVEVDANPFSGSAQYLSNVNGLKFRNLKISEKIMTVADLKDHGQVPYIIKRRSATVFYEDVNSHETTILEDYRTMNLAAHFGLLDELMTSYDITTTSDKEAPEPLTKQIEYLQVLIITESQHEWLTKKGVNLVSIRKVLKRGIEQLHQEQNFLEVLDRVTALSRVKNLKSMYSIVSSAGREVEVAEWKMSDSPYKKLFTEYSAARDHANDDQYLEMYAKRLLYTKLNDVRNLTVILKISNRHDLLGDLVNRHYYQDSDVDQQLENRYPMLKVVNYNTHVIDEEILFETITQYIDHIDLTFKKAAEETEASLSAELTQQTVKRV